MKLNPPKYCLFLFFYILSLVGLLPANTFQNLVTANLGDQQTLLTSTEFLPVGSINFVTVGDPNNAPDYNDNDMGAVSEIYRLGKNNITAMQYCAFLNAVAAKDDFELYDERMASDVVVNAITRHGKSGHYHYSVVDGQNYIPITYVGWFAAARFCNWLQNGLQGPGSTEYGAYTFLPQGQISPFILPINPGATYFLPTPDQWYKAVCYNGGSINAGYYFPIAAQLATWTGAYGIEGLFGNTIQWLSAAGHPGYGPYSDPSWGNDPATFKANNIGFRVAATLPIGSDSLPEPPPSNTPPAQ